MNTISNFLWPIVALGGLGAFIDFVIGKRGQERARNFLIGWWVKFDDVKWNNFGRQEALYAVDVMDCCFGKTIWSLRRVNAAILVGLFFLSVGYFVFSNRFMEDKLNVGVMVSISLIGFVASISLTRLITWKVATFCGDGQLRNITIFMAMLVINYLIITIWGVITSATADCFQNYLVYLITGTYVSFMSAKDIFINYGKNFTGLPMVWNSYTDRTTLEAFMANNISSFAPILRLLLSLIFVLSFVIKPVVLRPMSVLWARILESEKPVFTVIFGGAAAFAKAIGEAAKHF